MIISKFQIVHRNIHGGILSRSDIYIVRSNDPNNVDLDDKLFEFISDVRYNGGVTVGDSITLEEVE